MTDTTKPPDRPTSPRPPRLYDRTAETLARTGDKPRSRPGDKRDDSRSGRPSLRQAEPAPREDDARIAKVMARAGLCSRRDAETWIAAGRVAVNGAAIDSPALNVKARDVITVDGMPLPDREPTRLFMFHKPRGLVTTSRDPEGRPTIFENLPEGLPRVVSVGRLDINTEGLMLLTNDGGLARVLELPATGWLRRYRVRANGEIDQARLDKLRTGITIDGVAYAGIEATLDRIQGSNAWLTMGLREGKNREIKRVLETLGLAVTRLIRISFGPFQLGDLAEGAVESVPARVLRDQLGPGLAAEAGIDLVDVEERTSRPAGRVRPEPLGDARPDRAHSAKPRAHVSALRAARDAGAQEGRQRIERSATADRKGRAVKVERVIPVGPGRRGGESRNARRFAEEPAEAGTGRRKTLAFRPEGDGEIRSPARRERAGSTGDRLRGERSGGSGDKPRGTRTRESGTGRAVKAGGHSSAAKPGGRVGGFGSERPATGRNRPAGGGRPTSKGSAAGDRPTGGDRPRGGPRTAGGDRPKGGGRPPRR